MVLRTLELIYDHFRLKQKKQSVSVSGVIIGIDGHIFTRQIAGVTEITTVSIAQLDCDGPLLGFHFSAERFDVESAWLALTKNSRAGNVTGDIVWIESGAAVTDSTDDSAPIGIGAVKGGTHQRTIDNRS